MERWRDPLRRELLERTLVSLFGTLLPGAYRIRSVAVVFAGEGVPREEFLRRFTASLGAHGSILHIRRERIEGLDGLMVRVVIHVP